jgi:nucleoside-diphosphate-sugar epimerase
VRADIGTTWKGKRVLVTGGTGFVGGHLMERLVREGAQVRVLTRQGRSGAVALPAEVLAGIEFIPGSVTEVPAVEAAVRGVEYIFHLAAIVSIPYSRQYPRETFEANTLGTVNVLIGARQEGVSRLVVTSTSDVYGQPRSLPVDEDHPLRGLSPYSATSKIGAEKAAESFHASFELPVTVVRPFNTYGPRQSLRAIIPTIIAQALQGGEIRLGDTTRTRDFTFVQDTVEGMLRAAASERTVGTVLNIGTGIESSVAELAQTILALTGREGEIVPDPQRFRPQKTDVPRLCAGIGRSRELLGWAPHTGLIEGLDRTISWFRSLPELPDGSRYVT